VQRPYISTARATRTPVLGTPRLSARRTVAVETAKMSRCTQKVSTFTEEAATKVADVLLAAPHSARVKSVVVVAAGGEESLGRRGVRHHGITSPKVCRWMRAQC